jgi:hypothetical protein
MLGETRKNADDKILENIGISRQETFEADQNVLGIFAILLAVDKRINPENYKWQDKDKKIC